MGVLRAKRSFVCKSYDKNNTLMTADTVTVVSLTIYGTTGYCPEPEKYASRMDKKSRSPGHLCAPQLRNRYSD